MDRLVLCPEIWSTWASRKGMRREVISPIQIPCASFVISYAGKVKGDPVSIAEAMLHLAAGSPAYAIALEIATAHVIAGKALNAGGDADEWIGIVRELSRELVTFRRNASGEVLL